MNIIELKENVNFTKTCRLCLNQNKELIPIFTTSNFEIQYSIIINECTGVTIFEIDELPKNICLECEECLNKFYQFRKLVVNSEHYLYDLLNKLQNNLNNDVKIENTTDIKEESLLNDSSEKPSCSAKNDDPEQDLKIKSEIEFIEEEISENEPLTEAISIVVDTKKTVKKKVVNPKLIFNCKSCEQTFAEETDLKNHENTHLYNYTILPLRPTKHKRPNKKRKPYKCKQCIRSYSNKCDLKKHLKIHTGTAYVCSLCNKPFGVKAHLIGHERTHSGEKPFKCDECEKSFVSSGSLNVHKRTHRGEKACNRCGKSFAQLEKLIKHKKSHEGEKPFTCDQCGKSFIGSAHLKKHQKIHTGARPYVCDQCGISFTQIHGLRRHVKIHTGEKSYICDQCGKSFAHLSNLKLHERIHTGVKPYTCEQCGKSFRLSSHLSRHKKIHTDKKCYKRSGRIKASDQELSQI